MTLFKDKYRVESTRLDGFDYSGIGSYFVTIVTHGRECLFGDFIDGKMILNDAGKIVRQCWLEIPNHFPYASLDEFVIMPDHVHGIIVLGVDPIPVETPDPGVSGKNSRVIDPGCANFHATNVETPKLGVSYTNYRVPGKETPRLGVSTEKTKTKHATIGVIINQFKRICTITIRKQNSDFAWQSRFYDHIIRNDDELGHIREYILDNPQNWQTDAYTEEKIEGGTNENERSINKND
ncbi:MAG: transposase [Candidatus Marinimicrobia bacterium CG08_land_8_20_14_0_20_45_22]|nr:MAG: transposase [Candidatus Marinimicrobia bacterium CG08_land_8_20_14_0_20_45_22]